MGMLMNDPKVVASSNLGLKLANTFGVIVTTQLESHVIIRCLVGVIIGIAYGALVSVVVFLLVGLGLDETHSSAMFGDPVALRWVATVISGLIAGGCAVLVGLVAGVANLRKGKAAITGFVTGLLALGLISINSWSTPHPMSLRGWIGLFVAIAILPIGVALTGMVAVIVTDRLPRH